MAGVTRGSGGLGERVEVAGSLLRSGRERESAEQRQEKCGVAEGSIKRNGHAFACCADKEMVAQRSSGRRSGRWYTLVLLAPNSLINY
jgi:hypothetical protein